MEAKEAKEFKWQNDRYNQTREQHDGLVCGSLDTGIAYGLMAFSGVSFVAAGVLLVLRLMF